MKYIFTKIFGVYLLVIIILTGLILAVAFNATQNYFYDHLSNDLSKLNHGILLKIRPLYENNEFEKIDSILKAARSEIQTRITIIDLNGKVVADSEKEPETMENHRQRPEIQDAYSGNEGESLRYSTTIEEKMFYVAVPIKSRGKIIGVCRASLFLRDINDFIDDLQFTIIKVASIFVLLSLVGLWFFSRSISKPIKTLAGASRKVAAGDFDTKVRLKNKDELKDLADSFNYMTKQIKNLFRQVTSQKEELNTIISSIRGSLLVIDSNGVILFINAIFRQNFMVKEAQGRHYGEVIDDPAFDKMISKIFRQKNYFGELSCNNKYYICSASHIRSQNKFVIILYDVTEVKRLEQMKRDFIMNVSHELRTPLTAIKGFIETMSDDVKVKQKSQKKKEHYFNILIRHTDRLINIVNDLSLIAKMEDSSGSPADKMVITKVWLPDLINNVLKIFEQKLNAQNMMLVTYFTEDIPVIYADAFKLEQLFVNLVDNAIKYSDAEKENKIQITVGYKEKSVNIEVRDNGIGIPTEHLDRIFERFYTVDKSRSRLTGGTGLGLSLVKHIVNLHRGTINVQSEMNKGSIFNISLPINLNKILQEEE